MICAHPHARVERRHRILEDHLHLELSGARLRPLERLDVLAVEPQRAIGGLEDAGDDPPERGLAASGFADQSHNLARCDGEVDPVDRVHHLFGVAAAHQVDQLLGEVEPADEALADPIELDHGRRHGITASRSAG